HRGANQRLERGLVDLLALTQIDGAPHLAFEAGSEEARGILERRALREGELYGALIGLPGADEAIVRPHRDAPLPFLDHLGIRLPDQRAHLSERFASPVGELLDARVDLPGGRPAVTRARCVRSSPARHKP